MFIHVCFFFPQNITTANGNIDAYDTKGSTIGIFTACFIAFTLLLFFISVIIPSCQSGAGVNLPNKDYWFDPRFPERIQFALKLASIWLAYFTAWNQIFVIATYEVILEMMRTVRETNTNTHKPIQNKTIIH